MSKQTFYSNKNLVTTISNTSQRPNESCYCLLSSVLSCINVFSKPSISYRVTRSRTFVKTVSKKQKTFLLGVHKWAKMTQNVYKDVQFNPAAPIHDRVSESLNKIITGVREAAHKGGLEVEFVLD